MIIREIESEDVPAIFAVRTAADENRMSRKQLAKLGITERSVRERLQGTYRGWLAEEDGRIVGFAMGDCATGELWVIAVRPTHIRQGLGSHLLQTVEDWLWHRGCMELWLATAVETTTRAYVFYRNRGWEDDRIDGNVRYMRKRRNGDVR
jgi:GNAT superfamily N-acetyltransferase